MFDRKQARGHPSPRQAFEALECGCCMYAGISTCSGPARSVGLRDDLDSNSILVCKSHHGRLRKLDAHRLAELERVLVRGFAEQRRCFAPLATR